MYYAVDKNKKRYSATPEAKKIELFCPGCDGEVRAKTGDVKTWHFAHVNKECSYFEYKGMSKWHRDWQNLFPEEQREYMFIDDKGERHIADVVNSNALVIEFQNSPISKHEKISRDVFYNRVVWVVNADTFKENISLDKRETQEYKKYRIKLEGIESKKNDIDTIPRFSIRSDIRDGVDYYDCIDDDVKNYISSKIYDIKNKDIEIELDTFHKANEKPTKYLSILTWKWEREIWTNSVTPVFLDFNDGTMILLRLEAEPIKILTSEFIKKYVI